MPRSASRSPTLRRGTVTLACSTITRACGANRLRWNQVRTSSGSPAKPASTHVNACAKLRCLSCSVTLRLVTSCTRRWTVISPFFRITPHQRIGGDICERLVEVFDRNTRLGHLKQEIRHWLRRNPREAGGSGRRRSPRAARVPEGRPATVAGGFAVIVAWRQSPRSGPASRVWAAGGLTTAVILAI